MYPAFNLNESDLMSKYVRLLFHLKQLGLTYSISFFPVRALNYHGADNGWWVISNYTDLTNVSVFDERESGTILFYSKLSFKF